VAHNLKVERHPGQISFNMQRSSWGTSEIRYSPPETRRSLANAKWATPQEKIMTIKVKTYRRRYSNNLRPCCTKCRQPGHYKTSCTKSKSDFVLAVRPHELGAMLEALANCDGRLDEVTDLLDTYDSAA
jgi:hypothetical protein